jgi:hypothetical protein
MPSFASPFSPASARVVAEGNSRGHALLLADRVRGAKALDQSSTQGRRRCDADLLPEDCAHRELERVPRGGHPQPRAPGDVGGERSIFRQVRADRDGVGVEVEHPAYALDQRKQVGRAGQPDAERQGILRLRDLDHTGARGGCHAPPVDAALDRLDARNRPRLAVREHAGEVVRARMRQMHRQRRLSRRSRARLRVPCGVADGVRRAAEGFGHRGAQPAGAAEAGGVREVLERQVGLIEQPAREVDALAHQYRARRRAQVLGEEPPEMALADAEPVARRSTRDSVPSRRSARVTVAEVPCHAGDAGAVSGRQRRHGR